MIVAEHFMTATQADQATSSFIIGTRNKLHAPQKILVDEMEKHGFSDYFGIVPNEDARWQRFNNYYLK